MNRDAKDSSPPTDPDALWSVHHGDSRELGAILDKILTETTGDEPFTSCTITSPPYADLKSYDSGPDQIGQQSDYAEYLNQLQTVFKQVYDRTTADGTLWVVVDNFAEHNRIVTLPHDIIALCENLQQRTRCEAEDCNGRLRQNGRTGDLICDTCEEPYDALSESWILHDVIIWDKGKARPFSGEAKFRNTFEYVLCFKKSETAKLYPDRVRIADPTKLSRWWVDWPERYDPRGTTPDNVWNISAHNRGAWGNSDVTHPAAFPPELVTRIIRFASDEGDIIFDPFAGSGTVVAQANAMDRRGIGIELGKSYVEAYPSVQDEITQRWTEKQADSSTIAAQQQRLIDSIWKLRQLVYANKLVQHLRTETGSDSIRPLGLHTVVVESKTLGLSHETTRVTTRYGFVFDNEQASVDLSVLESLLQDATSEKPWSTFNINATIDISDASAMVADPSKLVEDDQPALYLYPRGEHYWYSRRLGLNEWQHSAQPTASWWNAYATESFVPLVSNLAIRIERGDETHSIADAEDDRNLLEEPPETDADTGDKFSGSLDVDTRVTRLTDY